MAKQKNGTGSFTKRADGRIMFRVSVGLKGDGSPERKTFYGKSEKECRQKYKKWMETGDKAKIKNMTVAEWADKWLKLYKKGTVSYGTYHNYEGYLNNHIKPKLGKFKLDNVKPYNIQEFYTTISDLSKTAQTDIYTALKGIFETAVNNNHCSENPVTNPPRIAKKTKKPIEVFTSAEIIKIINSDNQYSVFPKMLLHTGLRVGEAAALKWSNVDLDNGFLNIQNSIARKEGGGWQEGDTKGRRDRTVYLTQSGVDFFASLPKKGIYVMTTETGGALSPKMFSDRYEKFFEEYNAEIESLDISEEKKEQLKLKYRSPHKCRHTYATHLVKGGAELMAVQALLGHTSVKVTEIYTHVNEDNEYLKDNITKLKY